MQTLQRHIVGVVGSLTRCPSPINQRMTKSIAHFLLLLVEKLLWHFLPHESQVASSRNHAQTDGFPGREEHRSVVPIIFLAGQKIFNGPVCKIAGCKNVRNESAGFARNFTASRQVRFGKCSMASSEFAKRVER